MSERNYAFDDFVDDCFLGEDPLCGLKKERSLQLVASQLLSELIVEDDQQTAV